MKRALQTSTSRRGASLLLLPVLAAAAALSAGCLNTGSPLPPRADRAEQTPDHPLFEDVTAASGIAYRRAIAGKRPLTILQTIGNGCAFLAAELRPASAESAESAESALLANPGVASIGKPEAEVRRAVEFRGTSKGRADPGGGG